MFAPGSLLFAEGDAPSRIFIIAGGTVKLLGTTARGKRLITKIAARGELLGLNAIVLGRPYLVTAEAVDVVRVQHVSRDAFLRFVNGSTDAAKHVIRQLSTNYYDAQAELRALNLSGSAREKLARRVLEWVDAVEPSGVDDVWVDVHFTHEDIAQMIGASRETVTRLFSEWTRAGIIKAEKRAIRVLSVTGLRVEAQG